MTSLLNRQRMQSILLTLALLLISIQHASSIARTIKIPLIRGTTRNSGQYGQPVVCYYTPLEIGTPAKEFFVQFDLGLSDLWVPHYTWNPFKINLHYGKGFQCKQSSTCTRDERELTVIYQNCRLTGKPYEDKLNFRSAIYFNSDITTQEMNTTINQDQIAPTVNGTTNLMMIRQKFLAMSDASDARFKDLPIDGFIGLSPATTSTSGISNILVGLHEAKIIDNLQFSFWFNPILDSNQGGELILGGVDQSRYQGQLYWHHLTSVTATEWKVNLQYVNMANQIISCQNEQCQVSFSSAINEIYGPSADVSKIYKLLGSSKLGFLNYVDCNQVSHLPYISFSIDGIPYSLLPTNYIRKTSDGRCYVAIFSNSDSGRAEKSWLLGTNFLGAYYSTFDITYRQIGFASLR